MYWYGKNRLFKSKIVMRQKMTLCIDWGHFNRQYNKQQTINFKDWNLPKYLPWLQYNKTRN